MRYRILGRTGLRISEIGFGAWGIGGGMWQGGTDRESLRALHKAIDLGVNFIDTALVYGDGHSEQLVGQVVRERKEEVYVATKVPPKNTRWPATAGVPVEEVFPHDYILTSVEKSLRNLQLDCIDLIQFHIWSDEWAEDSNWYSAVQKLKEQGKIRFFGISINEHQPENALMVARTGRVDAFQVIYNIFDQKPAEKLFPLCQELNIGIIVRVPFDEGSLTGTITTKTLFEPGDWRNQYFRGDRKRQVEERVNQLKADFTEFPASLPEVALRFCLSHRAVSTVIPGMRTIRHVESNCAAADGKGLPAAVLEKLKTHVWKKNFYA